MTRRRTWLLVHRVNGLLLAAFLTIVGATGSLLAWNLQLERQFARALYVAQPHDAGTPRADPLAVRENVARAFPAEEANAVDLSRTENDALQFFLTRKGGDERADGEDNVFADPYSGRILGARRYGDLREGWKNLMPFVYQLHQELALGVFGSTLLGAAALLWTIDCFVGMYLSFPASRKRAIPPRAERLWAWPARWRGAWLIRWNRGGFVRLYDVHRASGVWLWVMLLVFAWTGVAFNLPVVYRPVMRMFGASADTTPVMRGCSARGEDADWSTGLADARGAMQRQAHQRGFTVLSERFLSYNPAHCRWIYRVRSTLDVDRIGNTQLVWAQGAVKDATFTAATGKTNADTFTTWIMAMHEAQVGGLWFRVLVCISGAVTALLSVTGVWIFVRKLRVSRRRVEVQQELHQA